VGKYAVNTAEMKTGYIAKKCDILLSSTSICTSIIVLTTVKIKIIFSAFPTPGTNQPAPGNFLNIRELLYIPRTYGI
jgi:hypothetical protein